MVTLALPAAQWRPESGYQSQQTTHTASGRAGNDCQKHRAACIGLGEPTLRRLGSCSGCTHNLCPSVCPSICPFICPSPSASLRKNHGTKTPSFSQWLSRFRPMPRQQAPATFARCLALCLAYLSLSPTSPTLSAARAQLSCSLLGPGRFREAAGSETVPGRPI